MTIKEFLDTNGDWVSPFVTIVDNDNRDEIYYIGNSDDIFDEHLLNRSIGRWWHVSEDNISRFIILV